MYAIKNDCFYKFNYVTDVLNILHEKQARE